MIDNITNLRDRQETADEVLVCDTSEEITVDTASDTDNDMTKDMFVITPNISYDQEVEIILKE